MSPLTLEVMDVKLIIATYNCQAHKSRMQNNIELLLGCIYWLFRKPGYTVMSYILMTGLRRKYNSFSVSTADESQGLRRGRI